MRVPVVGATKTRIFPSTDAPPDGEQLDAKRQWRTQRLCCVLGLVDARVHSIGWLRENGS